MNVVRRVALLLVMTGALLVLVAIPALGQDTGQPSTPGSQEPAVTVTTLAEDDAQLDWTYRYMIPTALVLGVIVIVITSGQYFTSVVRKRYRIVEE